MATTRFCIAYLLIVTICGCEIFPVPDPEPEAVTVEDELVVPDVRGQDFESASSSFMALGLPYAASPCDASCLSDRFGGETYLWPDPGIVLEQHPVAGSKAPSGSEVIIVFADWMGGTIVHDGPDPAMPNLVAEPWLLDRLKEDPEFDVRVYELDERDLESRFGTDRDGWPAAGTIISQSPNPGEWPRDRVVNVEMVGAWSDVPDKADVPDVRGLSEADGRNRLSSAGYSSFSTHLGPRELSRLFGMVLEDWPAAGKIVEQQVVDEGTDTERVELRVADWPRSELLPVPVPELTALAVEDAIARLEDSGYAYRVQYVDTAAEPGTVLRQDVELASSGDRASVVLTIARDEQSGARDTDSDGVTDDRDECPNTPVGSVVDSRGCSAAEIAQDLEYGMYTFDPDSREMEAERDPAYEVSITLQTALQLSRGFNNQPSVEEFLQRTGRMPEEIESHIDEIVEQSGRRPILERWAGRMTIDLVAQDSETASVERAPGNIAERSVQRGETTWKWYVTPHCVSRWTSPLTCKPLTLVATATAHIGADGNLPYTLFEDEEITVEIAGTTFLALLWRDNKELILGGIVIPVLGFLLVFGWKRFGPKAKDDKRPVNAILILGANPMDTERLDLATEVRAIDDAIRSATYRECFQLHQQWAATASDIDGAFARYNPAIVHFSAHGTGAGELVLNRAGDATGAATPVESIDKLFELVGSGVRLVILNACYSEEQARALSAHIDAVVGMTRAIKDQAAIAFSGSFYAALADGRDLETAFNLACVEAGLEALKGDETPTLIASSEARTSTFAGA